MKEPKPPDLQEAIQAFLSLFGHYFQPAMAAANAQGAQAGQALGQRVGASAGALGMGASGAGQVGYGVGASLAGSTANDARRQLSQLIAQLSMGGLGEVNQRYGTQVQAYANRGPSTLDRIMAMLGMGAQNAPAIIKALK